METGKGQILLYQTPDGESRIEVRLQNETVWLSLDQMAELFQRNKSTISRHIKNVFEEGELEKEVVVAKFATTTQHGAIEGKTQTHEVDYYNLDMIISVGYPEQNKMHYSVYGHTAAEINYRLQRVSRVLR